MNADPVLRFVKVSSTTKDTLVVNWMTQRSYQQAVTGYTIGYQALGSSVIQFVHNLRLAPTVYEIANLHENTVYNVCVEALTAINASSTAVSAGDQQQGGQTLRWSTLCVTGATSSESISVVLGSTVGAFIALAVVVLFVVVAKWQHSNRNRKGEATTAMMDQRFVGSSEFFFGDDDDGGGGGDGHRGGHPTVETTADELAIVADDDDGGGGGGGGGLAPILVYTDADYQAAVRSALAAGASTSSLAGGSAVESPPMFVAELGDGHGRYGLLLPLSRATELLPLVVNDAMTPTTAQLAADLAAVEQLRSRRKRLQKYKTIDHGRDCVGDHEVEAPDSRRRHQPLRVPNGQAELNGDVSFTEPKTQPKDSDQTHFKHTADRENQLEGAEQIRGQWLSRTRSLSV